MRENMISAMKLVLMIFIIMIAAVGIWTIFGPMIDNNYEVSAKVVNDDTIVDSRGECWIFDNLPYKVGTELKVTFNDNCSTTIEDDKIIKIALVNELK